MGTLPTDGLKEDFDFAGDPPPVVTHPEGSCSHCGSTEGVELESSRTAYSTSPTDRFDRIRKLDEPDPNAPIFLCRSCAEEHHSYWNDMWAQYNSDRF